MQLSPLMRMICLGPLPMADFRFRQCKVRSYGDGSFLSVTDYCIRFYGRSRFYDWLGAKQ